MEVLESIRMLLSDIYLQRDVVNKNDQDIIDSSKILVELNFLAYPQYYYKSMFVQSFFHSLALWINHKSSDS